MLSNVCTHRGNLVVGEACAANALRCRYHGRTFGLDGTPGERAGLRGRAGLPRPPDDLPALPLAALGAARARRAAARRRLRRRGPRARSARGSRVRPDARLDPARSRDYEVDASWIAYVDNYLEGFHIPFVHEGLNETLDWDAYRIEVLPGGVLQVGIARAGRAGVRPDPVAVRLATAQDRSAWRPTTSGSGPT